MHIHRLASVSILLLATVGCSNNETPTQPPIAIGGNSSTVGGSGNGGANTQQGGANAQGGASTQQGGANAQGGVNTQQGGATVSGGAAPSGGNANTGGVTNNGGSSSGGAGGSATGGTTSKGGSSSGGAGGAAMGGATNKGGTSTAGGNSSGGSSNGGSNTGGTNAGGSSVGGSSTGGTGTSAGGANVGGGVASAWKGAVCTKMGATPIAEAFAAGYAAWKPAHVVECGTNMARVKGCQGDNNTCSEAIGYGMLLIVAAGDQVLFDKMNAFRKGLLAVNNATDTTSGKVMAWNSGDTCPPSASGGNSNSATDGDMDAAMALVQAEKKWPGGAYMTEAKQYLEAIWLNQVEKDSSGNPLRLKPGNLTLSSDTRDYISYYAPGYFHVFAQLTGNAKWTKLADAFYTKLATQQANCSNGQVPDAFGATDCKIWWDSCRAPWRIANDYGWFADANAKLFLDKLRSGSVSSSKPGEATDQKNSALIGAFAMSGISSDNTTMQAMCDNWESTTKDDSPYFQKTLRLLFMHTAGGLTQSGL